MINIKEIESYFKIKGYPEIDLTIRPGMTIKQNNIQLCVESCLSILKHHSGNMGYKPYYNHLVLIYLHTKKHNGDI